MIYYTIDLKIKGSEDRFEYCGYDGESLQYNPRIHLWLTADRRRARREARKIRRHELKNNVEALIVKNRVRV